MIEYDHNVVNPYTMHNEKPKVEFICTLSGVEKTMPIIRASEYKHSWQIKAVRDMKENGTLSRDHRREYEMHDNPPGFEHFAPDDNRHTAKCPAIQMWHNTGWIMRLHQDIKIKTIGNGEDLTFITPFQSKGPPIISKHLTHSLYPFFDNWPKDTMKRIIKINLPWKARIPKGYKMIQMHPYLLDENMFTTMAGVLDPHLGLAAVGTVPMWWHCVDDNVEHTLKEGTPIAQFVLVPKEEPDFEMIDSLEDPNYVKEERFNNILLTNTFTRSYARVREFWKKYGW